MTPTCPPYAPPRATIPIAWAGIVLGLACLGASARAAPPRLHAAAMPSPESITAYTTAICGSLTVAVNTAVLIWHRFHRGPKKPRKPRERKPRPERSDHAPQAKPA